MSTVGSRALTGNFIKGDQDLHEAGPDHHFFFKAEAAIDPSVYARKKASSPAP
jgi:hypothetical protein